MAVVAVTNTPLNMAEMAKMNSHLPTSYSTSYHM